jgi:hypothetical protein
VDRRKSRQRALEGPDPEDVNQQVAAAAMGTTQNQPTLETYYEGSGRLVLARNGDRRPFRQARRNEKKLEKDVGDMFEHFPPKSRG